jgi:hypothetical protein
MVDQPQKSVIVDILTQNVHEHFMRQTPKTVRNIAFNKPMYAFPGMHNFAQRGMASSSRPETMRMVTETWLKVSTQQLPYDLLYHF